MNFLIEKGGNALNREKTTHDAHYCSEEHTMAWMRETRIRTFMQLELEACLDEINWIRCHNCGALLCPQEEYPSKPLPIPPDYIDNLQSRLIEVKRRVSYHLLSRVSR